MASNSTKQWIPLQKQLVPRTKEEGAVYQKNIERKYEETIDSALKRGYLKCLDEDLILQSQGDSESVSELQNVYRISLNHSHVQLLDEIALLSCTKLRICNLGSCFLRDISAFYGSVNLLKLDLANNQICQLPKSDFWSSLSSLRVLYLHGNGLSGQNMLTRLTVCKTLHVLTLYNSPLALIANYRHHVVNSVLSLKALDNHVISDEEIVENLHLTGSFQPLTQHFRLQLYKLSPKGVSYEIERREVYKVLGSVNKVLARHSPVLILQRCIRGWLVRKALAKSTNQKIRSLAAKVRKVRNTKPLKPSSSKELQTNMVVATEMPLSKHPRTSIKRKKAPPRPLPPPPPPSSPYRRRRAISPHPIDTHTIGIDEKSSRAKYFMHINLGQLHQTVTEAELMEPEGTDKHFRTAFKNKPPRKGKTSNEASQEKNQSNAKSDNIVDMIGIKPESVTNDKQTEADDTVLVSGSPAHILAHEKKTVLKEVNKKDGAKIREAEKEISKIVSKLREPHKIEAKTQISAKDELLFTRAAATMAFSKLQLVEQMHIVKKKSDTMKLKTDLVAKVKNERTSRKTKIESFRRSIRERVRDWKHDKDISIEEQKVKQQDKRNSTLLQKSIDYEHSSEKRIEQMQDQLLANEFGVQNTMVYSTLLREDLKALKAADTAEKRDVVQEAKEEAIERQEMVKSYMDLRRLKLLQEGEEARKKLDSTMLEAASNRLIASRRKIDRENARKKVAREAIAIAKEELRRGTHRPNEGPMLITDTESQHMQFSANRTGSEFKSSSHIRHVSRDAHSTWQRGTRVLKSSEKTLHFPLIRTDEETPLMYGMLQPGTKIVSLAELSNSEVTSSTTSIMTTNKPLSVR